MGIWDAVKNISNKIAVDMGLKKPEIIKKPEIKKKDVINKNIEDEYGVLGVEKKHIWVFNSGLLFTGNPKWLFIYINKYRPDIKAFWLCSEEKTVEYIRGLGYRAYLFSSKEGVEIATASGVYVTEQCKEVIPPELRDCVCLNLYHGVGCKSIERKVDYGFLFQRIMKKYITNNNYYLNNMLFLVTSPLMEDHFKNQVGVSDDMVIRAGYPRCEYQLHYEKVHTFDHDILALKGRDESTKIVVYAPTYRDNPEFDFVNSLLPDFEALENTLKRNNQLLVFKLHPLMQNDRGFKVMCEKYNESPYFLFWDNDNDIYEIINRIDTAIVDYSSIFYDFLAGGVKNFIRYFSDYGSQDLRDNVFDYKEMTCGRICESFDELLYALDNIGSDESEAAERQRIYDLFWQYSGKDTMEKIIEETLLFEPKKEKLPTLYSFDVFDTLVSRKGLLPLSIFVYVREKMAESPLNFDKHLINNYVDIRRRCESNVRELKNKTTYVRNSEYTEISFDSIFARMAELYNLTGEQVMFLKEAELEAEYSESVPLSEMIAYAESLVEKGNDVILISDMYLPGAFIRRLIGKHSEILSGLPLYVSCEYGVQKANGLLFREVYKDMCFYKYEKWFHYGDNPVSDKKVPASLGIKAVRHKAPNFNEYENALVSQINTYDSYLAAALMARFRMRNISTRDYFSYAYASLCLVPYAVWVVEDAVRRNIDTLYFISRDGYHPKRIADAVIKKCGYSIKAEYIYGSRKAWRIPSFINEFDESFFLPFGNLASATTFKELLTALVLDEEQFYEFFPALSDVDFGNVITKDVRSAVITVVKASEKYRDYLLSYAKERRAIVEKYLSSVVDLSEKFAFVDYWGRGYTQTCLTRLLHNIKQEKFDVPYYYVRSIYPTEGHNIRYNYTCKNTSFLFVEALFSNIDYKSICDYEDDGMGAVKPVIVPEECDTELLDSMRVRLCNFVEDIMSVDAKDRDSLLRDLLDFSLEYFNKNQTDPIIVENLSTLNYSVAMYGTKREYAPVLTKRDIELIAENQVSVSHLTNSLKMSFERSGREIEEYYNYLTKDRVTEQNLFKKEIKKSSKETVKDFKHKRYNFEYDVNTKEERKAYKKATKKPVEDKVVFINVYNKPRNEFASLIALCKEKGYKTVVIPLKGSYEDKRLMHIATAKYIFLSDVSGWFSRIKFRKETKLIQFFREPFPLSGYSQTINADDTENRIQRKLRIHNVVYNLISCTGEGTRKLLSENLIKEKNKKNTKVLGNPLTDVYFSEKAKAEIRQRISEKMPLDGKKLMVYLPESSKTKKYFYDYIDINDLKNKFAHSYRLLVVSNKKDDIISAYAERLGDFACNGFDVVTQREAMAVADVVFGDCTAVLLEGAMTKKPLFFTSMYVPKEDGTSLFEEEEINIAPCTTDSGVLSEYIENLKEYDFEPLRIFSEKYFSGCDGKSAERILAYLKELEEREAEEKRLKEAESSGNSEAK